MLLLLLLMLRRRRRGRRRPHVLLRTWQLLMVRAVAVAATSCFSKASPSMAEAVRYGIAFLASKSLWKLRSCAPVLYLMRIPNSGSSVISWHRSCVHSTAIAWKSSLLLTLCGRRLEWGHNGRLVRRWGRPLLRLRRRQMHLLLGQLGRRRVQAHQPFVVDVM